MIVRVLWVIVFCLAAVFAVNALGGDLSSPAVFLGSLSVGTVAGLWVTWGDGKKTDQN